MIECLEKNYEKPNWKKPTWKPLRVFGTTHRNFDPTPRRMEAALDSTPVRSGHQETLRLDRVQSSQPNIDPLITVATSGVHEFFPIKVPFSRHRSMAPISRDSKALGG